MNRFFSEAIVLAVKNLK